MSTSSDNQSKMVTDNDDNNSYLSTNSSQGEFAIHNLADVTSIRTDPEKSLRLTRTETKRDLQSLGVTSEKPPPSITAPPIEDPIFPEEYGLETTTGLVKVKTLESLGRPSLTRVNSRKTQSLSHLPLAILKILIIGQ